MADPASPSGRIRRYIDEHGATEVSAGQIWVTFSVDAPAPAQRRRLARELLRAGVWCVPRLTELDEPNGRVVLRVEPPAPDNPLEKPLLGAGAAAVLLGLFLPWYTGSRGGIEVPGVSTGWEWLGVLDVYLLALGLGAFSWLIATFGAPPSRTPAHVLLGAAALGFLAVLYRIASPPDERFETIVLDMDLGVGPFVCLLGTAAILAGALRRIPPLREVIHPPRRSGQGAQIVGSSQED